MTSGKRKKPSCDSSPISCTSDCSSRSSTASNNYIDCLSTYVNQQMAARMQWTDAMDEAFLIAYVNSRENNWWDNKKSLEANYDMLAGHLVSNNIMTVTGQQLQTRFYHIKKKWDLFCNLRGISSKPETGVGWVEESYCFTADEEHWKNLALTNSSYAEFKKENSCYWYDRLTPLLLGSRAQSAGEIVPPEPPRRQRVTTSARSRKGKSKASTSRGPGGPIDTGVEANQADDVYYVPPIPGALGGKRPGSSLGTSGEPEGTRGSKSSRSSTGLEDAVSKIGNYTDFVLEDRRSRMEFESLYSVIQCQDVIKEMDIPDDWRIHANNHYADKDNEGKRVVFLRSTNTERFGYILNIMRDKGLA